MEDDGAIEIVEQGADGGADGGEGGSDEPSEERGGGEGGEGGHEGETDEERQSREDASRERERGGRPLDAVGVRKALRDLTSRDPDFAKQYPRLEKEVTGALFTRQKVNEMGGLQTISSTLEAIEARGGLEGIEQMAEELEAATQLEGGLERGDPAVINGWAKDFPDGFKRSVVPMLDALEKLDEERYEHVSSYLISHVLEKFGVLGAMSALGKAVEAKKFDEAAEQFNSIAKFFGNAKRLGANAKAEPFASRSAELDEREKSIAAKDLENFKGAVRADVNTQVTNEMNRVLRSELQRMKVYKVESGTANRMRGLINSELKRLVASDQNYSRQYDAVMKSGDRQRAVNFVVKTAGKYISKAVTAVVKDFNLRPTGRASGGGNGRPRGGFQSRGGDRGGDNFATGVPKTADVNFRLIDKAAWLVIKTQPHSPAEGVPLNNGKRAKW